MTTIDRRELIPIDYKLKTTDELEWLKKSIMHSISGFEDGIQALHREYTAIRIELATRSLNELEAQPQPLPINTDALEPEYAAWPRAGEGE